MPITAIRSPAHWKRPGWPSMATSNSNSISALKYRCFLRPGTHVAHRAQGLSDGLGFCRVALIGSLSGRAATPGDHLDCRGRGCCDLE